MKTRTFVRIYYPGGFFSETTTIEVQDRSHSFNVPSHARHFFQYQFFDVSETEVDGEVMKGSEKNLSKTYVKGTVLTYEDVLADPSSTQTLKDNMRMNKWDKVLKCTQGIIPLDKNYELSPLN
jgi:hypothetical protein